MSSAQNSSPLTCRDLVVNVISGTAASHEAAPNEAHVIPQPPQPSVRAVIKPVSVTEPPYPRLPCSPRS